MLMGSDHFVKLLFWFRWSSFKDKNAVTRSHFTFKDSNRDTDIYSSVIKELEYVGALLVFSSTHFSLFYAIYLKATKKAITGTV